MLHTEEIKRYSHLFVDEESWLPPFVEWLKIKDAKGPEADELSVPRYHQGRHPQDLKTAQPLWDQDLWEELMRRWMEECNREGRLVNLASLTVHRRGTPEAVFEPSDLEQRVVKELGQFFRREVHNPLSMGKWAFDVSTPARG